MVLFERMTEREKRQSTHLLVRSSKMTGRSQELPPDVLCGLQECGQLSSLPLRSLGALEEGWVRNRNAGTPTSIRCGMPVAGNGLTHRTRLRPRDILTLDFSMSNDSSAFHADESILKNC